jgi:MipA family protein
MLMQSALKGIRLRRVLAHRCAVCLAIVFSCATRAQEVGPPPDAPMSKDREIVLGLGAAYQPDYMGSDNHKVRALPIVMVRWRSGWFAGVNGVGYRFSSGSPLSYGVQLGFNPGRDEDDSNALRGIGDIKARPELGAFASYQLMRGVSITSMLRYGSGNERDGMVLDVGVRGMLPLQGGHRIVGGVSTSYANRAYTESFFGVTPAQALTSGYRVYAPGGGIRDVSVNVGYGYAFTPDITMMTGVTYRALQGDAKDSPLTRSANNTSANVLLTVRF